MKFRAPRKKKGKDTDRADRADRTSQATPTTASQASSGRKLGLPSLALKAVKIAAAPVMAPFKHKLGAMPALGAAPSAPAAPNLGSKLPDAPAPEPISAGFNGMQARMTPSDPVASPQGDKVNKDMVVAASQLAAGFAQAAATVQLNDGDKDEFLDISRKMLKYVALIEQAMVDEQDTTIVHASTSPATSIVQQPFMPTVAPVPQDDSLTKLLSMGGAMVMGVGSALMMASEWLGSLWTNYATSLYNNVKNLFALGWSKIVTGFNAASTWITGCVGAISKWVTSCMATVTGWIEGAASAIKNLWNSFDLSKIDILDFDLSGLWAKLSDLSVFGDWGNAVKIALGIFGGLGLGVLKTVFSVAGKLWRFVKPVVKILGKVARFLGPVGLLFGIASVASNIDTLIDDAAAIVDEPTTAGKITAGKTLLAHAMRTIAEAILPDFILDKVFNSEDQDEANKTAKDAGITEATGNVFGADYCIKDASRLSELDHDTLQSMLDSGDYSDEDEALIRDAIEAKATEASAEPITPTPVRDDVIIIPKVPDGTLEIYPDSWQDDAKKAIQEAIDDNAIARGPDYAFEDLGHIENAISNIKNTIKPVIMRDGISEAEFDRKFSALKQEMMRHYYHLRNSATESAITEQPMPDPTNNANGANRGTVEPAVSEEADAPVSSAAVSTHQTDGTLNVAGPTPTVTDVESKPDPEGTNASEAEGASGRASAAADYATSHAHPKSTHYCARYVANSLQAAGYKFERQGMAYQYVTNGILPKMGFSQVDMGQPPRKGDISVIGPRRPGHAGHISIFNGKNWVSDFIQRRESPYAQLTSSQWMTRWRDTGGAGAVDAVTPTGDASAAMAVPSGVSPTEAMLGALNTVPDAGGARPTHQSPDAPVTSAGIPKRSPEDTGLELDDLLFISNGFS